MDSNPNYLQHSEATASSEGLTSRLNSLYQGYQKQFGHNSRLMQDVYQIFSDRRYSPAGKTEKIESLVKLANLGEPERKFLKRGSQISAEIFVNDYISQPAGLKNRVDSLYESFKPNLSSKNSYLLEKLTNVVGNRGYSHERRVANINYLLSSHTEALTLEERDYVRRILITYSDHLKSSSKKNKIKGLGNIEKELYSLNRDFEPERDFIYTIGEEPRKPGNQETKKEEKTFNFNKEVPPANKVPRMVRESKLKFIVPAPDGKNETKTLEEVVNLVQDVVGSKGAAKRPYAGQAVAINLSTTYTPTAKEDPNQVKPSFFRKSLTYMVSVAAVAGTLFLGGCKPELMRNAYAAVTGEQPGPRSAEIHIQE